MKRGEEALSVKVVAAFALTLLATAFGDVASALYLNSLYGVEDWFDQLRFSYGYMLLAALFGGIPVAVWLILIANNRWTIISICAVFTIWTTFAWVSIFNGFEGHEALAIAHVLSAVLAICFALFAKVAWTRRSSAPRSDMNKPLR